MEQLEKRTELIEQQEKDKIITHVDNSINQIKNLMKKYINSETDIDKADKLAYWLEDYCKYLNFEKNFKPHYLKTYTRGDIIKVNLGYNIGNEEGGLHYCVVVDKNNLKSSGIITVIPLTSYKNKPIHFSSVFLGDEIYKNFKAKYDLLMSELSEKILALDVNTCTKEEVELALQNFNTIKKMDDEIVKMKKGSVALVSQIVTVSKQKIVNPQKKYDILSDLRLSDESLDLINKKIKQLFIKN